MFASYPWSSPFKCTSLLLPGEWSRAQSACIETALFISAKQSEHFLSSVKAPSSTRQILASHMSRGRCAHFERHALHLWPLHSCVSTSASTGMCASSLTEHSLKCSLPNRDLTISTKEQIFVTQSATNKIYKTQSRINEKYLNTPSIAACPISTYRGPKPFQPSEPPPSVICFSSLWCIPSQTIRLTRHHNQLRL